MTEREYAGGGPGEDVPPDPQLRAALGRLQEAAERPPEEHVEAYEQLHRTLQQALANAQDDGLDLSTGEPPR